MLGLKGHDPFGVEVLAFEFLPLVLQKVEATRALFFRLAQACNLAVEFTNPRHLPRDHLSQTRFTGVSVERDSVHLRMAKCLGTMLARDFELSTEQVYQGRDGNELAADSRAAATTCVKCSPNDQLRRLLRRVICSFGIRRKPSIRQRSGDIVMAVHPKECFNRTLFFATAERVH